MTETHLNAPVKNCGTCAHHAPSNQHATFNKCAKYGYQYANFAIHSCQARFWQQRPPIPPRRSLRQWLYDTLFA